jgi:hypothetical protein
VAGTSISALSTEYVQVPVRAQSSGLPFNPTALTVEMAFIDGWTEPQPADWNTASWASTSTVNGTYLAQCLVGPENDGVSLAIGTYQIWLKVISSPEVPVISTGTLTVTT